MKARRNSALTALKKMPTGKTLVLELYIAGESPNSLLAVANLTSVCREHAPDNHALEIIDVLKRPKRALADGILLTPTLIKTSPAPPMRIVGNLSEATRALPSLGLRSKKP